jgi:hypothetical protein
MYMKTVTYAHLLQNSFTIILIMGVCILLRVWDQGEGFFRVGNIIIVKFLLFIIRAAK